MRLQALQDELGARWLQQRVGGAGVDADLFIHAHAFHGLQGVDLLLIDPGVAADQGHAQQRQR